MVFNKSQLERLLGKAEKEYESGNKVICKVLYRNKSEEYFKKIKENGGIMEPYLKDRSGDPKNPINDTLKGLFFFASVEHGSTTVEPMDYSQFGPRRFTVPVEKLIDWKEDNLYFADFFCLSRYRHYVSLVHTQKSSSADLFCAEHLPRLELTDNQFFFYDQKTETFQVNDSTQKYVEIFYTEDIDVEAMLKEGATLTEVRTICNGRSTPGGKPKNSSCRLCNL